MFWASSMGLEASRDNVDVCALSESSGFKLFSEVAGGEGFCLKHSIEASEFALKRKLYDNGMRQSG